MCMVYGVERHAARRRRIASPRTCGAPRGCNLSETVLPLVIHGEMTWCAPRRRQRTRFCRCDARNRLRGPSLITRRRNSRGIAILVGASRLGRVSLVAFWGSLSSAPSEPTARVHNVAFSSFIDGSFGTPLGARPPRAILHKPGRGYTSQRPAAADTLQGDGTIVWVVGGRAAE